MSICNHKVNQNISFLFSSSLQICDLHLLLYSVLRIAFLIKQCVIYSYRIVAYYTYKHYVNFFIPRIIFYMKQLHIISKFILALFPMFSERIVYLITTSLPFYINYQQLLQEFVVNSSPSSDLNKFFHFVLLPCIKSNVQQIYFKMIHMTENLPEQIKYKIFQKEFRRSRFKDFLC